MHPSRADLVSDETNPRAAWHAAMIEAVAKVTRIAPPRPHPSPPHGPGGSLAAAWPGGSLATVWREGGNPYLRFAEQPVGAAAAITGLSRSNMGSTMTQAHFVEATKELLPTLQGVLDERL